MNTKKQPSAPKNPSGDVNRVEKVWRQNAINYLKLLVAYMEYIEREAK